MAPNEAICPRLKEMHEQFVKTKDYQNLIQSTEARELKRFVTKARGSDARWEGMMAVAHAANIASAPTIVSASECEMGGASGGAYDTCQVDFPDGTFVFGDPTDAVASEFDLLALYATREERTPPFFESGLKRVNGCIIIGPTDPPEE